MTGAKFSTPYVLARYLVSGSVALEHFSESAVQEPDVQSLADRVSLTIDDEYEAAFPEKWGAAVTVELADGRTMTGTCEVPRGDHRRPLSEPEYRQRTHRLLEWGLESSTAADEALDALTDLSERTVDDVVTALCR
jgi:2-methylcitrate dehydratase PrpD